MVVEACKLMRPWGGFHGLSLRKVDRNAEAPSFAGFLIRQMDWWRVTCGPPAFIIPLSDSAEWLCDIHGFPIMILQGYKYELIVFLFVVLHMCECPYDCIFILNVNLRYRQTVDHEFSVLRYRRLDTLVWMDVPSLEEE